MEEMHIEASGDDVARTVLICILDEGYVDYARTLSINMSHLEIILEPNPCSFRASWHLRFKYKIYSTSYLL